MIPALLAHGAALAVAAALLVAAGQPLFTDDAWWHLGLGRAFAAAGPWLADDPLLFDAASPPSASAWLFDLGLYGIYQVAGFPGLRVLHVAIAMGVLWLAWSLLRRASGSGLCASAGTAIFVALSAYRLVQLRPHLLTMALLLLIYRLLLEDSRPPGARRIAIAAGLFALWANLHAAFPIGLLLLGAAACACAIADPGQRPRARRLGLAWLCCAASTLANPKGLGALLPWLAAGASTPSLGRVIDEWAPVNPLLWPRPALPPTPLAWLVVWGLLLGCAWLLPRALARLRGRSPASPLDPAQLGAAAVSLAAMLGAVRFLWLGLLPLSQLFRGLGPRLQRSPRAIWLAAATSVLVAAAFPRWGDWPMITRALPRSTVYYATPYASHKYHSEAVWLLRETGVEGRLYCDYFQAGFVGFWLAPRVRTLVNGTLNVSSETLRAAAALDARRGLDDGESFAELLDRLGIDLFLGIRTPETGNPWRPWSSTTAHLARTPGWIPVFRNLRSGVYLRDVPRNRENVERVAAYYAAAHVPFDPERGFDPLAAIREAPEWAAAQGLVPRDFGVLQHRAQTGRDARAAAARQRVASLYTALGHHEEALALDRRTLAAMPRTPGARRRLVWNLLHLGRTDEAVEAAVGLHARPPEDSLSHAIADAAREMGGLPPEEARTRLAGLPVFYRTEIPWLLADTAWPEARTEETRARDSRPG